MRRLTKIRRKDNASGRSQSTTNNGPLGPLCTSRAAKASKGSFDQLKGARNMQENDAYTWQAAQDQQRPRVVAALVLASSCMIIGFVGGRLSTRILPPTLTRPAVAAIEDARTVTPTVPKVASSQENTNALAPSKPDRSPPDEPQKAARIQPSSAAPPVLLNPGSAEPDAPKSPQTGPLSSPQGAGLTTREDAGERDRARRIMRERGDREERARDPARTPPERSDYRALREYMLGR